MAADTDLDRLLATARDDPRILAVILFGSRARGEEHATSDVDVCIAMAEAKPTRIAMGRVAVDYAAIGDLDVKVFQALPLYVRRRVLKEGRVLFVRDEDALYDLAFRTVRAWESYRPHYEAYLAEVARGRS